MKDLRKELTILAALACMLTSSGCAEKQKPDAKNESTVSLPDSAAAASADESSTADSEGESEYAEPAVTGSTEIHAELSKADLETSCSADAVTLTFSDKDVQASAEDGVLIEDHTVTITKGGDYVLSGSRDDTAVTVDLADKNEKVHLFLSGISLKTADCAPITVQRADKTVITLTDGSENVLCDARKTDPDEKSGSNACIAAKDDLTINGSGRLNLESASGSGIHCKNDLRIVGGTVTVNAAKHGLRGNDSVLIHDGTLDIKAGGDGIKATTSDQDGKGWICTEGGTVTIISQQDGMDAAAVLAVAGGTLEITAGGGPSNAEPHADGMFGMPGRHGGAVVDDRGPENGNYNGSGMPEGFRSMPNMPFDPAEEPEPDDTVQDTSQNTSSAKGLKAGTAMRLSGGTMTLYAAGDALHSDGKAEITGSAVLTAAAGDDGIHAETALTVEGGDVNITNAYEGIEAETITVSGGSIRVNASDDGFNASDGTGGMGMNRNGSGALKISGGYVFVNADGDGLDSNGNITMTGGTVIVCGPTNDGNGPLDSGDNNNQITVTGGTLVAVGSTGMMEAPEENYLASAELNAAAGTLIGVTDEKGKVLAVLRTPKQAKGIVVSADSMADGYQIYTGGSYDGELNDDGFASGGSYTGGTLIASGSGGNVSRSGRPPFGDRFGRQQPPAGFNPPEGFEPPDGFEGMTPPDGFRNGQQKKQPSAPKHEDAQAEDSEVL